MCGSDKNKAAWVESSNLKLMTLYLVFKYISIKAQSGHFSKERGEEGFVQEQQRSLTLYRWIGMYDNSFSLCEHTHYIFL